MNGVVSFLFSRELTELERLSIKKIIVAFSNSGFHFPNEVYAIRGRKPTYGGGVREICYAVLHAPPGEIAAPEASVPGGYSSWALAVAERVKRELPDLPWLTDYNAPA